MSRMNQTAQNNGPHKGESDNNLIVSKFSYFKDQQTKLRLIACLMWLFGCSCFFLSFIYSNHHNIPPQITLVWRGGMSVLVSWILLKRKNITSVEIIDTKQFTWCLIARSITALNFCVIAFCQFYLPLPYVHTINSTLPIFTSIIDYYMYNSKLTLKQICGMVGAFIGIFIIVINAQQPDQAKTQFKNYRYVGTLTFILLHIFLLFNIALVSFAFVITKKLTKVQPLLMTFYGGIIFLIYSALTIHINFGELLGTSQTLQVSTQQMTTGTYLKGFIFSGLILTVGNTVELWALKISNEYGKIAIIQNFTVVLAYFFSIFVYSEPVNFICFVGVLLTIYCVIITLK